MARVKPIYVYCVVKSAEMRKKNGTLVCSIPFGNQFRVLSDMKDGYLYGETYMRVNRGYAKYRGFVNRKGFTDRKIIDMSYLYFRNNTGKRIPTTLRYKGKASGWIEVDEKIHALAKTDDGWILTGKGWTRSEWMSKVRTINDNESMKTLAYAVITQAVKDYQAIVHALQANIRYYSRDCADSVTEMKMLRKWFSEGNYLKIIDDQYSGEDRLQMIDNELGVTEEWIKTVTMKRRIREP